MKPITKSKTIWLNAIALLAVVLTEIQPVIAKPDATWLAVGLAVMNIVLRFFTTKPLTVSQENS